MKKFAQIENNKAHWIFEAETMPEFAPNIVLVNITEHDDICEGWDYDESTGVFTAPVIVVPEPIEPQLPADEIIRANYLETQYQTILLEMQSGM